MGTVKEFDHEMILTFLKLRNLKYLRDSDGDFRVDFAYDEELDCQLTLWLMVEGKMRNIYTIRINTDKRIPRSEWGRVMFMCNSWNKERRWPKAYLFVRDLDHDKFGMIHLEAQFDLEKGIHQEFFNDFTSTIYTTGHSFWKWAHTEHQI